MSFTHFDEKSGIVPCKTEWGQWWQTVDEIHVEVVLKNVKTKEIKIKITANSLQCTIQGNTIINGKLFGTVRGDESIWTVEDNGSLLNIVLPKAEFIGREKIWESLLENDGFKPDPYTFNEMRKKLDLEKFQIENPGMDFSKAQLKKCYDTLPGSD